MSTPVLNLFNSINEGINREADENDRYDAREKKRVSREKIQAEAHKVKTHKLMSKAGWELKKKLVHTSTYKHPKYPGHSVTVHHEGAGYGHGEFTHTVKHHDTLAGHIAGHANAASDAQFDATSKALRGPKHGW